MTAQPWCSVKKRGRYIKNISNFPLLVEYVYYRVIVSGFFFQNYQDFDIALSKYKIAAQFLPESISLWNNIGMCFFEKKKYVAVSYLVFITE